MTYEFILERMMNRVIADYPDLDTREGSMLFNALAPAAMELAIMYDELDNVLNESFIETASREYILRACTQMGIDTSEFDATYGTHKAHFNVEVPIGSRWNCNEMYNYTVIEQLPNEDGFYTYELRCETAGTAPNAVTGTLTPIDFASPLLSVSELVGYLILGEDEFTDDKIVKFYLDFVNDSITDGNVAQYEYWCETFDGIGNYKVIPLWNGVNTVKVSILDANNDLAGSELIDDFQDYLDPDTEGMGNGVAPIGAFVTVGTATKKNISVSANVKLKDGYSDTSVITTAIQNYFKSIAYKDNKVGLYTIGAVILNVEGVDYITTLKLNNATSDIALGTEEIPYLSNASWTVIT